MSSGAPTASGPASGSASAAAARTAQNPSLSTNSSSYETPGCPRLDSAPTVHHPVTAANKKPAGNPGRFTTPRRPCHPPPVQHCTPTWPPSPTATAKPPAGAPATPLTRPAALGLAGTPPSTPRSVRSPSTTTAPGRSLQFGSAAPARSRPARRSDKMVAAAAGSSSARTSPASSRPSTCRSRRAVPLPAAGLGGRSLRQTRSYCELAAALGRARAVGLANGRNPVSIVVPCHRVIGADGSMTGYGGGVERKRALLEHERGAGLRWLPAAAVPPAASAQDRSRRRVREVAPRMAIVGAGFDGVGTPGARRSGLSRRPVSRRTSSCGGGGGSARRSRRADRRWAAAPRPVPRGARGTDCRRPRSSRPCRSQSRPRRG